MELPHALKVIEWILGNLLCLLKVVPFLRLVR